MAKRKFVAIRFIQGVGADNGQEMYLFSAPARWLAKNTTVDKWDPDREAEDNWEEQGYQRALSESHLKAIERYLKGAQRHSKSTRRLPVFPTSVLLAMREAASFEAMGDSRLQELGGGLWVTLGSLALPEDESLFIIDGQHRLAGLKRVLEDADCQEFGDYYMPVTMMVCGNKLDELMHFMTINKEAKSVRTDLAERLLDTVRRVDPERILDLDKFRRAKEIADPLEIVRYLEVTQGQPWFGRIAKPNERRGENRVASEGQLVKSLRHICEARPLRWDSDKLKEFVRDFWIVLSELLPEAFAEPRNYTIQKGVGFGALHRVLPSLASCYDGIEGLRRALKGVDPYFSDSNYWVKGGEASSFSSEGGYKDHADRIKEALDGNPGE